MSGKPTKAPCREACPAGVDVPRYLRLIAAGGYAEALAVICESIPLPAVCGYVCPAPCELKCQLAHITDGPEAIRVLKRFAADQASGQRIQRPAATPTGKRVAVVGSGPAGLTAAYRLAMQGHKVILFEALHEPGGMMRVGIPAYRLPRSVLDQDIQNIVNSGVELITGVRIESPEGLLAQGYDAVFLAIGAHRGARMGIAGEESPGVVDALSFLRQVHLGTRTTAGSSVAVVGGGNSAVDAARTALRLGADEATIVYRRTRKEMRAYPEEVQEALREGVNIIFQATPSRITAAAGGRLRMECLRTGPVGPDAAAPPLPIAGSEFCVEAETVIVAVGQAPEIPPGFLLAPKGGTIGISAESTATSKAGVFAGGDCVTGPRSVIEAIAAGKRAAADIDRYLGGRGLLDAKPAPTGQAIPPAATAYPPPTAIRTAIPLLPVAERFVGFPPVELPLLAETAVREASRCLQCDLPVVALAENCRSCFVCQLICSLRFEGAFDPSKAAIGIRPVMGSDGGVKIRIAFTDRCDGCGLCVRYCPFGALTRGAFNGCSGPKPA